jgi:hypothetical protein
MKRTKEGGAILYNSDGEKTELTNAEFIQGRFLRDLGRVGIVILTGVVDFVFIRNGLLTIGMTLMMLGWRLKTGW